MSTTIESPAIFSNREEQMLEKRVALDELDREIMMLVLLHPRWSNTEIGEKVGLNRIQVWRRRTKGPLATLLLEFQREALESASELVINEARGAIERLGALSRGECDCSSQFKYIAENHREVCLSPVPYAVQRAAAKDLIEILQNRPPEKRDNEEEVWESVVSEVGSIQVRKITSGTPEGGEFE